MWPGPRGDPRDLYGASWAGRGVQRTPQSPSQVPDKINGSTAGDRISDLGRFPANLIHVPKASRSERERWCGGLSPTTAFEVTGRKEGSAGMKSPRAGIRAGSQNRADRGPGAIGNDHPTVKPLALIQWLCRLVTPVGGTLIDPFVGSGTTALAAHLEGFTSLTAELTYSKLARGRLRNATLQQEIAPARGRAAQDLRLVTLPEVVAPTGEDDQGEQLGMWGALP